MTRFRVTVRGTDIELRGYVDGEATLRVTSKVLDGIGIVVASPAADDYNPFAITEPDYPPTPERSYAVLTQLFADSADINQFLEQASLLHFGQANVIRGERYLREKAEAELRDRELHHFEVEQELAQIKGTQDQYTRDMVARVDEAEGENDRLKGRAAEASAIADALSNNWESGDLAGAVNEAIAYLRGLETA
jgi:hypothetical protein